MGTPHRVPYYVRRLAACGRQHAGDIALAADDWQGHALQLAGARAVCEIARARSGETMMVDKISFSKEEKADIIRRIQQFFVSERDERIGEIAAELLLDFFSTEIGGYYYNRGLYDAQTLLRDRIADITDAIFELEKPE
jgi:uncharacterized protein (DUF2164 family)